MNSKNSSNFSGEASMPLLLGEIIAETITLKRPQENADRSFYMLSENLFAFHLC